MVVDGRGAVTTTLARIVWVTLVVAACGGAPGPAIDYSAFPFTMPPITSSPEPTPTRAPTTAPAPTVDDDFAPITLKGKGSKVVTFSIPVGALAIVQISEKGTSNFIVESLDSHGDTNDLLVNEIGNYSGTVLLDPEADQHSVAFKIESNGSWTFTIKPLLSARVWNPAGPLTGRGDDVIFLYPSAGPLTVVELKHGGESNFAIWTYGTDGRVDLLVNEIGKYTGQTILAEEVGLLAVTADGSWSITPQ